MDYLQMFIATKNNLYYKLLFCWWRIHFKGRRKTNIDYRKPSEFPCHDAAEILNNCNDMGISIADLVLINEETWLPRPIIKENCTLLWQTMKASIFNGINKSGELPGGLKVQRRASKSARIY